MLSLLDKILWKLRETSIQQLYVHRENLLKKKIENNFIWNISDDHISRISSTSPVKFFAYSLPIMVNTVIRKIKTFEIFGTIWRYFEMLFLKEIKENKHH